MTSSSAPTPLFSYRRHWAKRFGTATVAPTDAHELEQLGFGECDIILVTGDAYVDHPSFGVALIHRLLEAQGFRVGILAQPDWRDANAWRCLGRPRLFFGVTAGNVDSLVNHYTADKRPRRDDAYSPNGAAGLRPDRASLVYSRALRSVYPDVPILLGGIEASLRRVAHYDYWADRVLPSLLVESGADLIAYGSAERAIVEIAHRLAAGEPLSRLTSIRGTAMMQERLPEDAVILDASTLGREPPGPRRRAPLDAASEGEVCASREVVRLPAFEAVRDDPVLYAHAARVRHAESNPYNARILAQPHGERLLVINPPALPLTTPELDKLYELPFSRRPHPRYGGVPIPAYEMIRFSVMIARGCFGGCSFCTLTAHEGRIIQSRSADSVLREIENVRDTVPGFTGVISDLGGPTANMYRQGCREERLAQACRRPSCLYPQPCSHLETKHAPLIQLYRRARAVSGVKRVLVASGIRHDLALRSPEYVRELAAHHVGGYLKVAPEHSEARPLAAMMKPGIDIFERFMALFTKASAEAGKEQYLVPYFVAAHPGTSDEDMLALALWLRRHDYRVEQVQTFLPTPMALATAMYYSGRNPLAQVRRESGAITVPKDAATRRLHKAFLRAHDAENWPLLREALTRMGHADLIGNRRRHLVPAWQPRGTGGRPEGARRPTSGRGGRR